MDAVLAAGWEDKAAPSMICDSSRHADLLTAPPDQGPGKLLFLVMCNLVLLQTTRTNLQDRCSSPGSITLLRLRCCLICMCVKTQIPFVCKSDQVEFKAC